jgi:hypothetical protein
MLLQPYLKGANGEALSEYRPALAGSWVCLFMVGYWPARELYAECKTNRLVVLMVKSGLDPHMIIELEDGLKSCSLVILAICLFDFLNKSKLVWCECCIHADTSWCFMSVKDFKSAIRGWPNPSENFPNFSGIYSHFPLSYFYLLEGSKIFFMSSKYFIWIHHDPNHL